MTRPAAPARSGRLSGKHITLCVTGSVAAYKAVLLLRLLVKEGAHVEVALTASAERFVGVPTFSGLSGNAVHTTMFAADISGELHVDLAKRTDLVLIVPATADLIARLATGRADDLVAALVLCTSAPVIAAPAMHPRMWHHPATQRNARTLVEDRRVEFAGPTSGEVASGDAGDGRMVEPEELLGLVVRRLTGGDFEGRHFVVSAGPTVEDIDPVRFIGNRSSGKMGFALAERAARRGARVTLVTGPTHLPTPYGVTRVDVRSALEMKSELWQALGAELTQADALFMAAAVGDYRAAEIHSTKLKRADDLALELRPNPDILAEIGLARAGASPLLIGFAVEANSEQAMIEYARGKLDKKRVDLIVANLAAEAFGRDDDRATFVSAGAVEPLPTMSKLDLADRILDWTANRFGSREPD
jgi:phosphopantothenoylcysteine decarboxylase/phosphopantothenate--cysteine ligase